MSAPKFVPDLPPEAPRNRAGRPPSRLILTLRANAGRWAETDRFPVSDRTRAIQRAGYLKKQYADIEATTRTIDGEVVVYARAVPR